ncbi:hypothetical protein HYW87_04345, partial [Candidatus Roizmanbacteria bacterium]|nr:hypothetical protein [Candidatus Roizmanbacteria bacterium]
MSFSENTKISFILLGLIFIIGFNFYLYRNEFKVQIDPNDNVFQYALVDEAKNIWKQVFDGKLSPFYLLDSFNERWAEGFSLSFYYSHLPQAVIALLSFVLPIDAYKLFVIIRTLFLIMMPLSFYFSARILRLPRLYGLILAFFSQAIFTDGLYGIDSSSFIWRGWGLSAQLFAVFFLPLAFAYGYEYLQHRKHLARAILFNVLVAQAHFGIFTLLLTAYPFFWLVSILPKLLRQPISTEQILKRIRDDKSKELVKRSIVFLFSTLFFLSYFIVPFFLYGQYRNFSVWDPIWKFDSWGLKQILIWFLNGELFDFGRLPILT